MKIKSILIIFILLVFLTGCSTSTLYTQNNENSLCGEYTKKLFPESVLVKEVANSFENNYQIVKFIWKDETEKYNYTITTTKYGGTQIYGNYNSPYNNIKKGKNTGENINSYYYKSNCDKSIDKDCYFQYERTYVDSEGKIENLNIKIDNFEIRPIKVIDNTSKFFKIIEMKTVSYTVKNCSGDFTKIFP